MKCPVFFGRACGRKQSIAARVYASFRSREDAQALVEMAFALPAVIALVTGILVFGIYFMQYLSLIEGIGNAGRVLADNAGITLDPCAAAATAVENASSLNASNLSLSITLTPVIGGTSYSYPSSGTTAATSFSCSSSSTTTGAPSHLASGGSVTVQATYSNCSLNYFGNLISSGGCSITQSVTEVVQ